MKLLLKWLLSAAALLFVAYIYSGVEVKSFPSALIAAFVIGLFNVSNLLAVIGAVRALGHSLPDAVRARALDLAKRIAGGDE